MSLIGRNTKSTPPPTEPARSTGGGGSEVNALLGKGSSFDGKLVFEGTVHINGQFTGEIHSSDTLVVGEGAKVKGDIVVGTLIVMGDVEGTVRARHAVEMHAPARVRGQVSAPQLIIDRGVVFEGTSKMENLEGESAKAAAQQQAAAKK